MNSDLHCGSQGEPPAPGFLGPQGVFDDWITAIESLNSDAAAAFYFDQGMAFWGTFGDHCRTSPDQARNYFDQFLAVDSLP